MSLLDTYPVPDSSVVGRILESDQPGETEAVLVIPSRGKVKVLNEVGSRIWQLVDGQHTVREIASIICREFEVEPDEAEDDTVEFLNELADREVVSFSATPG